MADERLGVTADDRYLLALGRLAYVFATYEWNAVWCCEKLRPGYINKLGKKTAGIIATDIVTLAGRRPTHERLQIKPHALEFKRLVNRRNEALHGKPGTTEDGDQHLFSVGGELTITDLNTIADEFAVGSSALNALLYGLLK